MKYFLSIMKYFCLATLMLNTSLFVTIVFYGSLTDLVVTIINEATLVIQTLLFNRFAEEKWDNG